MARVAAPSFSTLLPPKPNGALVLDEDHDEGHSNDNEDEGPYQHGHQRAVGVGDLGYVLRLVDHNCTAKGRISSNLITL